MNNSRLKKSGINASVALAQNFVNIFFTFLSRIIFVHVLDEGYLGINGLFSNILNFLSLADLGIATAMMYSLYEPIARKDNGKIKSLIDFFRKIYLGIAGGVFGIGICLIPFLPKIIHLNNPIEHITLYYLIALLNVVLSYLFVYRTTLMAADQKSYILNNCIMVFKFVTFIIQIMVLVLTKNYLLYLFAALVINFICNWEQNRLTLAHYPFLKEQKKTLLLSEDKKKIFNNVKALFVYKVTAVINNDVDSILISIMVGTVYVGYYSNYLAVIGAVVALISAIFTAVKASVGNLVSDETHSINDELITYKLLEFMNYWIVAFSAISCMCLLNDCIQIFFGEKYVLPIAVVFVIILNFYTGNVCQSIWVFRETTGFFTEVKYVPIVHGSLNLVLSIVLGKQWGILGILGATVISRFLFAMWKEPCLLFRNHFRVSPIFYFLNYVKWGILTLVAGGMTWWACNLVCISGQYIAFGCKLLICVVVPNIIILLVHIRSRELRKIIKLIIEPTINKLRRFQN